ncbi:MAG: FAD-dependent oxidoreductase [Clostridia bacterium]|nr:FAD-dependent oxidoreductase [Clostridia bacterium]
MKSIFAATCDMPHFHSLREDAKADVLVIGGGIAGILTATLLQQEGADVLLLEAGQICSGQTGNTTAKITSLPGFLYADLLKRYGAETARAYWEANVKALRSYYRIAAEIDCDLQRRDFYAYAEQDRGALEQELSALSAIGAKAYEAHSPDLPFQTVGAVCVPDQAQFHPLRLLGALAKELRICENTPVRGLFQGGAETAAGKIVRATRVVVATHFPFLRFRGGYPFKMHQSRSYVLVLKDAPLPNGMYADGLHQGPSLRSFENQVLLGGAGHRTGVQGGGFEELSRLAMAYYPKAHVTHRFAAQDCMTLDGLPYIGRYTQKSRDLFVATGFGKWGMNGAMIAAMLLRDLILDRQNPYVDLFAPDRPWAMGAFLKNAASVLAHYVRPTRPRCPHLGCALRWNKQERSWDCPCHGSRFSELGELIDAPATHDLRSTIVNKR